MAMNPWNRRNFFLARVALGLLPPGAVAAAGPTHSRPIPASGEALPVIGFGTDAVFDVAGSPAELAMRRTIIDLLVNAGGKVVDSSPMYDRARRRMADFFAGL